MPSNRLRLLAIGLALLCIGSVATAQPGDPAALQQALNSQFKLTTVTADRSDIVTAGDVVVIHKPGLMMYAVFSPMPPSNTYKNGKIGQGWGGFGKDLAIGMVTPGSGTAANYPHRPFAVDEKCWVVGLQVQKDGILFVLYTDPYDNIRYYANLKIPFPDKKNVPPVNTALQLVAEVLTVVPQDQGAQQQPPAPAGSATQGNQQAGFSGDFVAKSPDGSLIHLILYADNSLKIVGSDGKLHAQGQFTVSGDQLTSEGWFTQGSSRDRIEGDRVITPKGAAWVRVGDAVAPTIEPAKSASVFSGEYLAQVQGQDLHATYFPDGSFQISGPEGTGLHGQYFVDGNTLIFTHPAAMIGQRDSIQGDKLVAPDGLAWVRMGDAPGNPTVPAAVQAEIPAPAPMPAIAPPPPPTDAAAPQASVPPTIALGQTMDQVTTAFGQPLKLAKVGAKVVFVYKDMKVTFTDGKVSDVE